MPLKTSSFKKEIVKQNLRNVGWVSIVYFIGLLFVLPLQLVMALGGENGVESGSGGLFSITFIFHVQAIFLFTMPVLMAIFIFRYMHVSASSDFIHSLPIKRGKLFNYHVGAGVLLLVAPIVIVGLILFVFMGTADVSAFYNLADLGRWTMFMLIVTLLVFIACVFVGTLTGLSAVQGVLTYIFLLFPMGIIGLIYFHLSFFIYGLSSSTLLDRWGQQLSPIVDIAVYHPQLIENGEIHIPVDYPVLGIYIVVTVLLYFLSAFIYKRRQLEAASHPIAVNWLKPVFKIGVTFCLALFFGLYFSQTQGTLPWVIFGYVLGGITGFFIATMLIAKTWRVFTFYHLKRLGMYSATVAALLVLIPLVFIGYENQIPEQEEVENVYVGSHYYQYEDYKASDEVDFIESEETIEAVRNLHERMLQERSSLNNNGESIFIAYQLKNGNVIQRSYDVNRSLVEEEYEQVSQTDEFKEMQMPFLVAEATSIDSIYIVNPLRFEVTISASNQKRELLEHLKQDIYSESYSETFGSSEIDSYGMVRIDGGEEIYFPLRRSYENTMEWLQAEDLYDEVILEAGDINHLEVFRNGGAADQQGFNAFQQLKDSGEEPLVIEDPGQINQVLEAGDGGSNDAYLVGVFLHEENPQADMIASFDEDEAPSFITESLQDSE
ncbi:DUF6449 domain-containing protein [Halobacillus campisalis]|uniref:DUF6449 domain-containing protein n=1 Tax=Halobacillus campisalis TaxID=435909 RepID=A0ABW2K0P7_9BACI|nr:DUF6449 domain-containing protein [Halobacillus campisalis]